MMRGLIKVFHLMCFAGLVAAEVRATQPLAFQPTSRGDFASILTVSGSIDQVAKQSAMIALFANKPFWGPPRFGAKQFALWPADTLFVARVPGDIPIIIDGKKAGFTELAAGQYVQIQYNIVLSSQEGLRAGSIQPYMYCVAVKIDARFASSSKSKSENHASKKR
jgi:hypothetical protein